MAYLTYEEYVSMGGNLIPSTDFQRFSEKVSRKIDGLTFNRIVGRGFDNLTDFQRNLIKEAMMVISDFEYENGDLIQSPLSSYSINGVSAAFNMKESSGVINSNGIIVSREGYEILKQTGLTCLLM